MKIKKNILLVVSIVTFVLGLAVVLYPGVLKVYNQNQANEQIDTFLESIRFVQGEEATLDNLGNGKEGSGSKSPHYTKKQLDGIYKDMKAYNKKIYKESQIGISDPFSFAQNSLSFTKYDIYNNLIGCLEAPTIGMALPIYLGANEYNMSLGAAYLSNTSMPIGGKNTNSVFAGHTAYIGRTLFDNIVNLQVGDSIYITNFWDKLEYKVTDMKVVDPDETENILIQDGKDLITFTTCYPYGKNTHRYLVISERV